MKQKTIVAFSLFLVILLAACSIPQSTAEPAPTSPAQPENSPIPETPAETETAQPSEISGETQSSLTTPAPVITLETQAPCNRASAGRPLDVTIPDGAVMQPGQAFIKTWRLTNSGSCQWDKNYRVVFFSGQDLSVTGKVAFPQNVAPNETVEISVEMHAPLTAGMYQTNWKLQSPEGELFGLGPAGDAPFWAYIEVISVETPTLEPTSTVTSTPPPYASGDLDLTAGGAVDLDSGVVGNGPAADLLFNSPAEGQFELIPQNGARLAVYSFAAPTSDDCLSITVSDQSVAVDSGSEGVFLCYLSNQGLPGSIQLSTSILPQIHFHFETWTVP